MLQATPSQTVGPFFSFALDWGDEATKLVADGIRIFGQVLDGAGDPVPDTLVEVWQCNAAGRYRHVVDQHDAPLDPNFTGAGRCVTDDEGNYRFVSTSPVPIPGATTPTPGAPRTSTSRCSDPRS